MAIQVKEVPYEILIRLSYSGGLAGMHYKKLAVVVDDETGQTVSATELGPYPIVAEGDAEFTYSTVLGEALIAANNSLADLAAEVELLKSDNERLKTSASAS